MAIYNDPNTVNKIDPLKSLKIKREHLILFLNISVL